MEQYCDTENIKNIEEGDKFMQEAKVELSKSNWWFNRIDENNAIDLMNQAKNSYYLALEDIKGIDALLQTLNIISKSKDIKKHCHM